MSEQHLFNNEQTCSDCVLIRTVAGINIGSLNFGGSQTCQEATFAGSSCGATGTLPAPLSTWVSISPFAPIKHPYLVSYIWMWHEQKTMCNTMQYFSQLLRPHKYHHYSSKLSTVKSLGSLCLITHHSGQLRAIAMDEYASEDARSLYDHKAKCVADTSRQCDGEERDAPVSNCRF